MYTEVGMSPTAPFLHCDVYTACTIMLMRRPVLCILQSPQSMATAHLGLLAFLSKLNWTESKGNNKHLTRSIAFQTMLLRKWMVGCLAAMTNLMLPREKNTFSKCRDSTLRPVCYSKEKGLVPGTPQNRLSTSFRKTEMLTGCAGLELHTVGSGAAVNW